jgi:hypothetical protein
MAKRASELEAEVARWLAAAAATDAEEDKRYGPAGTGEEMPAWVADKQRRAEKIRRNCPGCARRVWETELVDLAGQRNRSSIQGFDEC